MMRIFEEILYFKATYSTKTNKTIRLSFASLILAGGRGHEMYYSKGCDVRSVAHKINDVKTNKKRRGLEGEKKEKRKDVN